MNHDRSRHRPLDPDSEAVQLMLAMHYAPPPRHGAWLPARARGTAPYHGWLARTRRTGRP